MVTYNADITEVLIDVGTVQLEGELSLVADARGLVLITNGSDSNRLSPRCQLICEQLNQTGLSTLMFNLLTLPEEEIDLQTQRLRYRIPLLARRIAGVLDWVQEQHQLHHLPLGILAADTAAGAVLVAATQRPELVDAIVCRGGWPELAGDALPFVEAPTLMIVGAYDASALSANEEAIQQMRSKTAIDIIPNASHLFEEPHTLEAMASCAADWFCSHLKSHQSDNVVEEMISGS